MPNMCLFTVFMVAEAVLQSHIFIIAGALILMALAVSGVYLYMQRLMHKKLEHQKEDSETELKNKIAELKREFYAGVSKEMQTPISQIITPLQSLVGESMSNEALVKAHEALSNAQELMHRVNMLLDTRYVGASVIKDVAFVLPKQTAPKVVYVPLEKKEETEETETVATTEATAPVVAPQSKAEETAAPSEEELKEQEAEEKAQFLQRMLERANAEKEATPVIATVSGQVDDSTAGHAANQAWESTATETIDGKHRFTMLMVDDAPDMCRFARDYFRGEYNVITANNGEQALKKLEEVDGIDLVVSDITMPKMDGFTLCKEIKSDLRWSHIPVILLTGRTGEEMELQGLRLGADDYITKPFNAETLRLRVKKFIEKKEMRLRSFKESEEIKPSELVTTDVDEEFIQKVIKVIEDNMSNSEFSVEVLGAEMDMSRTYLYKKLTSITGKGPGEFIRLLRVKRGKHLLERGTMQIAEVAAAVGYNTTKRFTENFKVEFDISPSEYMRRVKAKRGK